MEGILELEELEIDEFDEDTTDGEMATLGRIIEVTEPSK